VPELKHVNLYQYGLRSSSVSPGQLGVGILVPPHSGTDVCGKGADAQTGKAVSGVWPRVLQTVT